VRYTFVATVVSLPVLGATGADARLALVSFALVMLLGVLWFARVRTVRRRAAVAPPATSVRVRVFRQDPTGARTWEERELIPGARPVSRPAARPGRTWPDARDRFAGVRAEYAAFECDPMRVLRLPALTDVSVPSTARFVDAFADAQALATDRHPGPEHARRFVTAAERAVATWAAAREAAERIRLSGLTPAERDAVDRVVKLLTTARDSDSEPERLAAYSRARAELTKLDRAGVVHVPLPTRAALGEAARGQLPGPTAGGR
jgi:hypothetical protein